ncbi:MAG: alpha/beta hydrolase [Gammaproteobacteria bacterium]|nr:alpha/beta hydrolase [Gammaproteobacteria bacterium]
MDQHPILYLLPGLLCDQDVWQHQVAALSQHAEIRVPDYRGVDSLEIMTELVLNEAPEQFSVAGYSMGGKVALELINRAPERIQHLMLISVGAHPVTDEECKHRGSLVESATNIGMERYAVQWADTMMAFREHDDAVIRSCIENMVRRQSLDNLIAHITAALGRRDQSLYLSRIKLRVLLIVGEQDSWSPVSQHEAIRDSLSDAILEVVPDAGHMVLLDQPDLVSNLMTDWFLNH